ncbi:PREDICTED: TMV resistance protein N-like isoform X3 [Ipomoea nil]|uniref:TMV resistance protein N-like isoform X3 n=1 Tax=Ipomoea nil TaxID=35883 RepID=UPI0009017900|nr:PREDICTED: TMV resistance protein N-like isoform X3 [Ipomoea nil]
MAISTINLQPSIWEYDVFLSFRGEDTRKTFTSHLYSALCNASIHTFRDEEELKKGESLAPELTRAIQNSRVSIIVFSKNYASSRWCLDELLQILECREKGKQLVYPIFYDVEPSEVRSQSGNYGMALAKHEERFSGSDKVQKWRDALTKVANMSGWDLQGFANGYESKFIDEIVQDIVPVVSPKPMFVAKHEVGLESRVDQVLQFNYETHENDVRMIGIYGMRGIGKSTLAKALYNKLFGYFERSYFLEISSQSLETKKLQKELLSELLKRKIKVGSEGEGKMLIKRWLQAKKCLIVLDNLEHRNQFEALCGERDWFGKGSTLILTTRDAHLLKELKEDELYKAKALVHEESLQLFSLHAFREPTLPKEDYAEVLDGIVAYFEGLPLALEVIGSYLSDKSKEEWISAFEKLRKIPHDDVLAKLKISYEGLPEDHTKSLFLDLVCFSHKIPEETNNAMGHFSTIEIRNIVDKCLINYSCFNWMYSLIPEMGREIIHSESPNKSGERSRLWCPNDVHDVLIEQKGMEKIEMIVLNSPMKNMEYNQIDEIHLEGNFKHLPRKTLRCLQWNQCPVKSIPFGYFFDKLVKLKMWESNIKEFGVPLKYFLCHESLDLGWCENLTRTPDFSGAKNLHKLSFYGSSLEKVHYSNIDLWMQSKIDLWGCERLKKLPSSSVENSGMLTHNFPQFPPNLEDIRLYGCKNLEVVSATFPTSLEGIVLYGCTNLKTLLELPQNLQSLYVFNCESLETVHLPKMLEYVKLTHCKKLKEIQGWENAQFLTRIELRGVPNNIKFSEIINKVLKVSKLNSYIEFEGYLPNNETLSWIKFEENGSSSSSISFQLPPLISNLEFLEICISVVLPLHESSYARIEARARIEKDGFRVWTLAWYSFVNGLEEAENVVSFVNFIPQDYFFKVIKAGEIFEVIFEDDKKCMVKKIRVEALYRDREDGFLQILPLTKLHSNTQEEEEEEE